MCPPSVVIGIMLNLYKAISFTYAHSCTITYYTLTPLSIADREIATCSVYSPGC